MELVNKALLSFQISKDSIVVAWPIDIIGRIKAEEAGILDKFEDVCGIACDTRPTVCSLQIKVDKKDAQRASRSVDGSILRPVVDSHHSLLQIGNRDGTEQ
jgi:hypothetical protein